MCFHERLRGVVELARDRNTGRYEDDRGPNYERGSAGRAPFDDERRGDNDRYRNERSDARWSQRGGAQDYPKDLRPEYRSERYQPGNVNSRTPDRGQWNPESRNGWRNYNGMAESPRDSRGDGWTGEAGMRRD